MKYKYFIINILQYTIISLLLSCSKEDAEIREITGQKILVIGADGFENLNFGEVIVNRSAQMQLAITNSKISDLPLNISNISLPSGYSSDWTSAIIDPGVSRNLVVTFNPSDINPTYRGTLKIESDKTAGIDEFDIIGVAAVESVIIELAGNLNFGTILARQTLTAEVIVTNTGIAPLVVTGINLPNTTDFSVDWDNGTIQPNSSQTITLTFNPQSEGDINGVLEVISNATNNENTLSVSASVESNIYTDSRDGTQYPLVSINGAVWMQANLAYDESAGSIDAGGTEGRFYTSVQAQAAVPGGWHVASDNEWKNAEQFLGLESDLLDVICDNRENSTVANKLLVGGNTLEINYSGVGFRAQAFLIGEQITFWTSTSAESEGAPSGYLFTRIFESTSSNNIQRCADGDNGLLYSVRLVRD